MDKQSLVVLTLAALAAPAFSQPGQNKDLSVEPPMLGLHWARGEAHHGGGSSPNMTWHGQGIMQTTQVQAIFWGTSWTTNPGDKISGMETWYQGVGGASYARTSDEYTARM